jgi:hypothetical protein
MSKTEAKTSEKILKDFEARTDSGIKAALAAIRSKVREGYDRPDDDRVPGKAAVMAVR